MKKLIHLILFFIIGFSTLTFAQDSLYVLNAQLTLNRENVVIDMSQVSNVSISVGTGSNMVLNFYDPSKKIKRRSYEAVSIKEFRYTDEEGETHVLTHHKCPGGIMGALLETIYQNDSVSLLYFPPSDTYYIKLTKGKAKYTRLRPSFMILDLKCKEIKKKYKDDRRDISLDEAIALLDEYDQTCN